MFDLLLTPFVIARRVEKLSQTGSTATRPVQSIEKAVEVNRMVSEKVAAFQLGMLASSAEILRSASTVSTRMMRGDALGATIAAADTPRKVVSAGFAPAARILRSNARRLKAD